AAIVGSAATYTYTYNPDHQRVKLLTQLATGTQTTIYLHPGGSGTLFYEKEIKSDSSVENRHYVQAGGFLVGVYVTRSSYGPGDGPQMLYYHRDHLGSITAISNEAGAVVEPLAYEAYGKRRFPTGLADPGNSILGLHTERGFTAHEHLDELGLIHMNGRVYDPLLGRFFTADPTIESPGNLQSYNRYSYVWNNPLGASDPTGYRRCCSLKSIVAIAATPFVGPTVLAGAGAAAYVATQAVMQIGGAFIGTGYVLGGTAGALAGAYSLFKTERAYEEGVRGGNLLRIAVADGLYAYSRISIVTGGYQAFTRGGAEALATYAAKAAARRYVQERVSDAVERFAEQHGMSLYKFNALLFAISEAGNQMLGSRFSSEKI